jgi:hypothetical protein
LAGSELLGNITYAFLKNVIIFCSLLPKLDEGGIPLISDNNDEPACYILIDSNWHTRQQDKCITFPKFPEVSCNENILADNNYEMYGSDKI